MGRPVTKGGCTSFATDYTICRNPARWVTRRVTDVRDNPRLPQNFFPSQRKAMSCNEWRGVASGTIRDWFSGVLLLDKCHRGGSNLLVTSESKMATSASRIRMICLEAIATVCGKHAVEKTSLMSCNSPGLLLNGPYRHHKPENSRKSLFELLGVIVKLPSGR